MLNLARRLVNRPYSFATTRYNINYYDVLELQSGATTAAIKKAYADLTQNINPQVDSDKFKTINEAFVILTDLKTRDAYDSLLAVRKSFYLNDEKPKAVTSKSYLAVRKQNSQKSMKKKLNIDEFGRYKGGLPHRHGQLRGNSRGPAGSMYRQEQVEQILDPHPQYNVITAEKAQNFKDFHQDERKARTMKWPWFSLEVDYGYFTFRTFRKKYWPKIQFFILFFYILPSLYYAVEKIHRKQLTKDFIAKANELRAEKQRKQKQAQEPKQAEPSLEGATPEKNTSSAAQA